MAKQFTETKQEKDEFAHIFNDYRSRIDEITRQMQKNLGFEIAGPVSTAVKPEEIVIEVQLKAETEAGEIFPRVQDEPELKTKVNQNPVALELVPVKESEEIIREAKQKASRIVAEAEKRVKDEAKKKTELQATKIIAQAQKEAQDIIARAGQSAEEQKSEIISTLKQQAQQVISEIVEKCRQDTQEQSSLVIRESRDKAIKMINDILSAGKEISLLMDESVNFTGKTIIDFETKIKSGNETLLKAISQSQNKFMMITTTANEVKTGPEPQNKHKESKNEPALAIHLLNYNPNGDNNGLFHGKIEVKSISAAFEYANLKNLKKYLMHFPGIKYLQESASEKAVTMLFDITEPVPLLNMLHDIPQIEEVIFETDDNIWLIFKNSN